MAIKIKPRAKVTPAFVDLYKEMAQKRLEREYEFIRTMDDRSKKRYMARDKEMWGRLTAVVKGAVEAGAGIDFEVSRIRNFDYTIVDVVEHKGQRFLTAKTPELIIAEIDAKGKEVGKWDAGVYGIFVSEKNLMEGKSDVHFIPKRNVHATNRHFHHAAINEDYSREPKEGALPLDLIPQTCWSQFATPVSAAMRTLDLVELLRSFRDFVGRFYNGSPLRQPWTMEHLRKIEE